MNLFDFTAESSERKKTLNPFGSYLEKNTDRFVKGAKENIPAPRAKNVKRSEGISEELVSKPKPSLKELLAKRYGTEEDSADNADTSVTSPSSSYSEPTTTSEVVSEPDTSFTSAMGRAGKDLAQSFGAVGAQIPRIGANIASIPLDIVGGRYFWEEVSAAQELAKTIREGGETITSKAWDIIGLDDTRKKIASVTTDFASTVALPGWVLGSGKVLQWVNLASKTGTKLARAWVSATSWVIDTAKYEAISKWRLPTKNEAIVGWVLSPVLNVAKSVPGIRKLVGKSEILNPWENVLDNGKIIGSVEDVKNEISQAAERLANIKAGWERGEEWVKKEADRVIRWVMKVDEKSIASHKDIAPKMKEQEGAILQMKKLHNQKSTERFGKTSFDDSVTVGGTTNKFNAVDDAFDALSDKAASSQAKLTPKEITSIDELKRRYDTVWLDKDELDTLAGYYGRVNDAFKQWGLVTNKVLSESTRNMMKDKVRTLWGKDDVAESLDKTYSDIRAVREWVDELMGLARNETSRMDNKPLSAVGKFLWDTIQNSTLWVARGFLRALFGAGEIKSWAMSSAEIAKIALEDLKKIRKYKELLDGAVDEKTARGIVDKMRNEFSVWGIIPKPKTLDDTIPKIPRKKNIPKPKK